LRADGLVSSRRGSGTVVAGVGSGPRARTVQTFAEAALADHRAINLAVSAPPDASALGNLVLTAADLVSVDPAHGYAPGGLPSLRAALAARHTRDGLPTSADGIHVTNGAQHALALILAAHCRPGDTVAVEDPTYVGLIDVAAGLGLRLLPLPGDLGGPDPQHLVRLCRSRRVRAAVLLPAVHSPTGRRLPGEVREALARDLDACPEILVVEDNTLADLAFGSDRPPSLAALCETAPVVSVESLSKVAWGGLRIGWLRARPALLAPVTAQRGASDIGSPVPSQLIAAALLDRLDEVIAWRRAVLAQRAAALTGLLRAALPEWAFPAPDGGLSLWVDLGPTVTADRFAQAALAHGVAVAPGSSACVARSGDHHLRLCFDRPEPELRQAAARLAAAHDHICRA
jgi:DNA-binding transcriptional MocR family regulator